MAPRLVVSQNRTKLNNGHNNINAKKLSRALTVNAQLHKRIRLLSFQNKELSSARNSILLQKLALEKENNSIKNSNIQLTAMHHVVCNKLRELEQTLQTCVPALVTMSQCIPSMLRNVHEMSKFENINENSNKEKKERLTKKVKPMVHGMVIHQPAVNLNRLPPINSMSPIIESPVSEQTPRRSRNSSGRSSLHGNVSLEPYVRLKDVAVMLKNTKAVPNENSRCHPENLGEGPSWLHSPENHIQNIQDFDTNVTIIENTEIPSVVPDEIPTQDREEPLVHADIQADMSTSASSSNFGRSSTSYETEMRQSDLMCTPDSSMLRNITSRKRQKRRSSESSFVSEIDESTSSLRSRRSATKKVNYKEPNLLGKLRRN